MFGWVARIFRGAHRERAPAPRRPPREVAKAVPVGEAVSAPASEPPDATGADPFAPFAAALGIPSPPSLRDPDLAEEEAGDRALADRVLDHFSKNRPGPASSPALSLRVLNLVAAQDADIAEMVRLISADPALSAGVLTVANSAYYRGLEEIETVRAAVVRLGLDEVARVVGALSAKSLFNPRLKAELAVFGPRFSALYHRALTTANGAAWLAMQHRGGRADRAFLGGMLFDVGKSISLRSIASLALQGPLAAPEDQVERVIERLHVEVGAECHQEWQLPQYLTVIAVRHHDREIPAHPDFIDLHAVRLCGALLDLRASALAPRAAPEIVQSAAALGMTPLAVRTVDTELRVVAQRVASTFGL
jgi:HD-like signal output (HDOD) protein